MIGAALGAAKIISDKNSGRETKTSVYRKAAGVVVSGIFLASLAAVLLGASWHVLLIGVGVMMLFFGTRRGMVDPFMRDGETKKILKDFGFEKETPFTRTLATVDIKLYAGVLKQEFIEQDKTGPEIVIEIGRASCRERV